ncbi:protein kinase subdomain-containing protein PKL/CAK/Fmp29 [Coprinopsis cinerea AmutBmut pab1-1]|nr:protein kinase subdomain-containing protein PKL/CAK/Fmp29 [Coprinopsis cinerea AmutBmut pab1-1]
MRFLRERLGLTQIPRVLSCSSRAEETPVGAEHIIMDVADGVSLLSVWDELTMSQKLRVVDQWIKFESVATKAISGGYGSLYYRNDLPPELARDLTVWGKVDEEFVLGPSTVQLGFWEGKHGNPRDLELELDRGPWPDVASYLKSISNCERAWIRKFAKPPPSTGRTYRAPWEAPPHLQIPEEHIHLLNLYDNIVAHLIPTDKRYHRPSLTLRDSHHTNIFLSKDALDRDGSIQISSIIDWQHTAVLPLYLTAFAPQFIQQRLFFPGKPKEEVERENAYLHKAYYMLYNDTKLDTVWASLVNPESPGRHMSEQLPGIAQFCWHGGFATLKLDLITAANHWEELVGPGVPFPHPELCKEDVQKAEEDAVQWAEVEKAIEKVRESVGVYEDGWVSNVPEYEEAIEANDEQRKAWVDSLTEEEKKGLGGVDPADIWLLRP